MEDTTKPNGWQSAKVSLGISHPIQSGSGRRIGVDREREIIFGYVVAQEGPFKSEGRGEFDREALVSIESLMRTAPNGLKSRLSHPDLSNDGIGKFLGRARDPWIDTLAARESVGSLKSDPITCVRGDLYIDPSSHDTPNGDIGNYVMDLAESDPDAMSSSLVLQVEEEYRIDAKGLPLRDKDGVTLPPLWMPTALHASDIVDTGDAVDGLLSSQLSEDGLPDGVVRKAAELLKRHCAGKTREEVEVQLSRWRDRALDRLYGAVIPGIPRLGDSYPIADEQEPEARHDGCRSAHGLHYQKECRKCGGTIESCGCKDRLKEGRVIRMGTCEKCSAPDAPRSPGDSSPDPGAPGEEAYASAEDQASRVRALGLEQLDEVTR